MKLRGIDRSTACVVAQTVVTRPTGVQNPTKPVGAFLSRRPRPRPPRPAGPSRRTRAAAGARSSPPEAGAHREFDAVKDLMNAGYIVVSGRRQGAVFEKEGLYEASRRSQDRSSWPPTSADMLVI
ncbi:MAG: hypothetical protein ACLSVD_01905 [Eggerthellaceae bacterium]